MIRKILSLLLSFSLIITHPVFAQGVSELNIGKCLNQMPAMKPDSFRPPHLRYISYDIKSNDFKLLLDQGDAKLQNSPNSSTPKLQDATQELFNYFLIGLSLPNDKFWVNLRPDAPQQIIDPLLEKTDMGKIMLEADLELKKDTAGLTSPQNPEGKEYWDRLYKKAGELFGTENITIPTITRPWIVPGEVIIRESEDSAYIYKANLKVMLEEDYLNNQKTEKRENLKTDDYDFSDSRMKELNKYSTELIKELILPRLTQEINTSKKYAQLRQVFFSLILSRWFKDKYKGRPGQYSSLIDSRNLDNLNSKESWNKEYYFNEYKKSFQQGEYNLKEQVSTPTGQVIRSYVSGGANMTGRFIEGSFKTAASPLNEDIDRLKKDNWMINIAFGAAVFVEVALGVIYTSALMSVTTNTVNHADLSRMRSSAIRYMLSASEIDTILFAINKDMYETFSQVDFKTLEDFRNWLREQKGISREARNKIEGKLSTLEEEMRPMIKIYLDSILQELNSFKESSNSVKTDKIMLTMFTQELLKDFNKRKASIKDYGELLGFIDGLLTTLDTAYTEEEGYLEQFKTKVPYNFKELFDNTMQRLAGIKLQVYKAVQELNGSSPMTLTDAKAELENISNEYSGILNVATDDMLENILASDTWEVFLERMLIVTSIIAYELAHSKKSSEVFKSKVISALIKLMGKCKYGKQLSNDEEIIKEMKAVFVRKMERLNAISSKYLGDKTYPSWDAYAKEMKEVAHRDVETPKKAELKKIISSFEKKFSISKYVIVFPQNLTMVGDLAVTDISEYLELKILQYAIGSVSSSIEVVFDSKNQESGNMVGGIDFRKIDYLTQPMGSFRGLDLRLPLLSKAELDGIDIKRELAAVEQMINAKIDVSTDRLKRLLAAMARKDAFTVPREAQLLPLLLRLCWLKEEKGAETTPDFRAVLLIADTGLFVEQGTS